MNIQQFPAIVTDTSELFWCGPVDKLWTVFILYTVGYMLLSMTKMYFITFTSVQISVNELTTNSHQRPKCIKNLLFAPVQRLFLRLHKNFQVTSTYDTNIEYQIWNLCNNLLSVMLITDSQTHMHTEQSFKMGFLVSGGLKTCKSIKILISKIWPQNYTFSTICLRESKKYFG